MFSYTYFDAAIRNTLTIDSGKATAAEAFADIRRYMARTNRRRGNVVPHIRLPNHVGELRTWSPDAKAYVAAA